MNSFISRIGGKKSLRNEILKRFPEEPPERYIEPFGGAGWVLFASARHAKMEIFNDIDGELINLFRCVKFHCEELQTHLKWIMNSRELFEDSMELQGCHGLTDIQRAALHFLVIKESFGSDVRTYGGAIKDYDNAIAYLSDVRERLKNVRIENRDFRSLIKVYDSESALFYIDPPYHGTEKYYKNNFNEEDHICLKELLNSLKGKFILSYNDDQFIRDLYQGFSIEAISRQNNLAARHSNAKKQFKELIIKNF